MPVRHCQIKKIQEHAEKWSDNRWTTSPKKDMLGSCHYGSVHELFFLFNQKQKPQRIKTWNELNTIPAWDVKKVRRKSEVIRQAKKDGKTVHFVNLMDLCRLKNAELAKHLQKYKGRVVLLEDTVKDEEGHRAVFTEQGASASEMTAAKFLDTISKLPVWAGETSDAMSAYTQVKMTEVPRWLPMPNTECLENVDHNSPRQRPEGCDKVEDPVVLLERHLYLSPIGQPSLGKKLWKSDLWKGMGGSTNNVYTCPRSSEYSYRYTWMIKKRLDRSKIWILCGKLGKKKSTLRIQRRW